MKISLINLPLTFDLRWEDNVSIYPPLGLCYIASVLRELGKYEVEIIDCPVLNLNKEQLKEKIKKSNPDIIGIACISPVLHNTTIEVSNMIKEINKKIIIVIGGPYATDNFSPILKENKKIDIVMLGEAEFTMLDVVQVIENKNSLSEIKGIAYREDNKIINTPLREMLKELDSLPFPAFDLLPNIKLYIQSSNASFAC